MTMTSIHTMTVMEIAGLAKVGAEIGESHCKGEAFFSSNKIQSSLATALHEIVEGLEIKMLRGWLSINNTKVTWPEAITLITVDGQWVGPGRIYSKEELGDKIKQECFVESREKIQSLDKPSLTMDYSTINGGPNMGHSDRRLVDLMTTAIKSHLSDLQQELLQTSTPAAKSHRQSRRV